MSTGKGTVRIYAEIGAILDDRMGTLNCIDLDAAEKIFHSDYHTRLSDEFTGVSMLEYRRRYQDRSTDVIRMSPMTNIFAHFQNVVRELAYSATQGPFKQHVEFVIDTFPYRLDVETEEALRQVIWHRLGRLCYVEMVYLPPEARPPAYYKSLFDAIYMYDPWAWLTIHDGKFDYHPSLRIPEILTFSPRLYMVRAPQNEREEEQLNASENIFTELEKAVSPIMGVNLIDVKFFSTPIPPYSYRNTTPQP